jgi:hypothetical protein
MEAWERADVDSMVAMLADEVTLEMPPNPEWYAGREAVAAFLGAYPLAEGNRWRVLPTRANGQLAFGHYIWRDEPGVFVAREISVLALRGAEIEDITIFRDPEAPGRFGLPEQIEP